MKEKIKLFIKKIPGIASLRNNILLKKEYKYDYNFFKKNYNHSKKTKNKLGYKILLLTHGIEKGLSNSNMRFFGATKVKEMMSLLDLYSNYNNSENDYYFIMGINGLRAYQKVCEENDWVGKKEYQLVNTYLKKYKNVKSFNVGSMIIKKEEITDSFNIDYDKFISSRHSVRNYQNKEIDDDDIFQAINMALKSPTACNRQMVKIYYVKSKEKKDYILKIGQGFSGFKNDGINIFVITFDINANYFVGERNQGWFNAGLVSMNFVNALHSLGIGSCFVQFGNTNKEEEKVKKILKIPSNERIAVLLSAGYYDEESKIPCSSRKSINDIYKKID